VVSAQQDADPWSAGRKCRCDSNEWLRLDGGRPHSWSAAAGSPFRRMRSIGRGSHGVSVVLSGSLTMGRQCVFRGVGGTWIPPSSASPAGKHQSRPSTGSCSVPGKLATPPAECNDRARGDDVDQQGEPETQRPSRRSHAFSVSADGGVTGTLSLTTLAMAVFCSRVGQNPSVASRETGSGPGGA